MAKLLSLRDRQRARQRREQGASPPPSPTTPTPRENKRPKGVFYRGLTLLFNRVAQLHQQWDRPLVYSTGALCLLGLFMLFSASARDSLATTGQPWNIVLRQLVFMVLGAGALLGAAALPYRVWQRPAVIGAGYGLTLLLLVLTALVGDTANGSERWLSLGPLRFQPSELAKPVGVAMLAYALTRQRWGRSLLLMSAAFGLMVLLIYKQPNLSITLLLSSVYVVMTFLAGVPLAWFALLLPFGGAVAYLVRTTPYQWRRIEGWLDPFADQLDTGYNLIQSWFAFAQGGLWGAGYGNSVQKLFYLPFHYTDFIFAVIAEEMGLLGTFTVVLLYAMVLWRGGRVGWQCRNGFGQLLAVGLTCVIVFQALINLAVATGLFPVTGVTLPLISYGGTSLVVTLFMVGMLLSISRENARPVSLDAEGAPAS